MRLAGGRRPVRPARRPGPSQVTHDDLIEKNLAHFHAAGADCGKRVEEAARAPRED
ncbi:hypothetical protein [Streptomyces sp. NPDC001820]|uniref:hypothetical protein n=1 Tax=Streptomyces sp. NPDC001820 TaxID=3364613 RepID=UPI00369CC702